MYATMIPAINTEIIIIDMIPASTSDVVLKKNFHAVPEIISMMPTANRTYLLIIKLLFSYNLKDLLFLIRLNKIAGKKH